MKRSLSLIDEVELNDENNYDNRSIVFRPKKLRLRSVLPNTNEQEYLELVQKILTSGIEKSDRTGTGTISEFGIMMKFNLANNTMPLLTTKRVSWKAIVEELLWFLSGSTDAKALGVVIPDLDAKGVKIWNDNGRRDVLDKLGFTERREGDLGPIYGFQWRHFGAQYRGCEEDYTGEGVDQIANVIRCIKADQSSRRMVLNAWNPEDLPKMALPPCHMNVIFGVNDGKLDAMMIQRSGDIGLGVPFNIASYALLIHMIAHVTGVKPGIFTHVIGDAHIYKNHVEQLKTQLTRDPYPCPTIKFGDGIKTIDDFTFENIKLEGYCHHPAIPMPFNV